MAFDGVAFRVLNTKDYSKLPLWLPKIMLSQLFLWPINDEVYLKKIISLVVVMSVVLFIAYGMIKKLLAINSVYEIALIMELLTGMSQTIFKLLTLFFYSSELKILLNDILEKFWHHDLMEGKPKKDIKRLYFFINIFMISMVIIPFLFGLGLFISPSNRRDLPFPVKYSFDWSSPVIFEIMVTIQFIGYQLLMIPCIIGTDLLFISIGICIVIQYRLLQHCLLKYCTPDMIVINKKLKNYGNDNDINDDRKQYFIKCVKHHQMLQRFTNLINKIFNLVVLLQLSSSICGICLALTLIARIDNTTSQLYVAFVVLISFFNQLLIYCVTGEIINHEAELLPQFIYQSKWTNLKNKYQRDLMFFIQQAQKVSPIRSIGIFYLNMETFLKVARLSFSFYTFFKTVVIYKNKPF